MTLSNSQLTLIGGGLAPTGPTLGSLLRTPCLVKPAGKMDLLENWIQKWICCKIGFKNGFAGKLDWPKS